MSPRLSFLLGSLCLLPLSCGEEKKTPRKSPPAKAEKEEEPKPGKRSLLNVPAGAVITDLTLPYYNKEARKISLLTIAELTVNDEGVVDETLLSGQTLKLWLFDRDEAIRSTTTIPDATYRVEKEVLEAEGEILMVGAQNQFAAKSSGGIFSLATGQALLLGPATTRFEDPEKKKDPTAMTLRPLLPLAAVAAAPILIAAPPEVTPEQLADFERQVAPRIIPHIDGEEIYSAGQVLNQGVSNRLDSYLVSIDKTALISQNEESGEGVAAEESDPLEGLFEAGPKRIVITCSKGIYLDGENREIVYLGDIKIEGRGLTMTCHRDLKAIFNPPAPEPKNKAGDEEKDSEKEDDSLTNFGGFGDLKQFTATGKVRLNGVNEDGKKIYLGGDRALYEMTKNGEQTDSTVTMRGDKLAFLLENPDVPGDPENKKSTLALRSVNPNAWVVATLKDKNIKVRFSDDGWETVIIQPE